MKIDTVYQEQLFKKLLQSHDLKKEKELLEQLFKRPIFWIADSSNNIDATKLCAKANGSKRQVCLSCLNQSLQKAKKTGLLQKFTCPSGGRGLCMPLVQGDALYGFLVLCRLKSWPQENTLKLFQALNNTILEKIQKELELSKLYQTIRPRAIALSTIHTIHRLISSSLDLNELLPRIARLSLQVLRARTCTISLTEKRTKHLIPKAIIDLARKKTKPTMSPIVKKIEEKILRTGNIILKDNYLSVPLIDEDLIGIITVSHKTSTKPFDNFDQEILSALAEQAIGAIKNAQLYKEQKEILLGTVKSLSTVLRVKSAYPYTHSKAFMDIILAIARELRMSEEDLTNLRFAAMLHDAEKVGIPEEILKKPAHLTGKEFEMIKERSKDSAKILKPLQRLKPAISIILHHHERFDGTGYPNSLKGKRIPLGARIMAVADSFEAMISKRPYRKATSIPDAIDEIKRQSGTQFDPQIIKIFIRLTKRKSFSNIIKEVHRG